MYVESRQLAKPDTSPSNGLLNVSFLPLGEDHHTQDQDTGVLIPELRWIALVAATGQATDLLGQQNILGTVEKGKLADLVILDADPLEDIRNTRGIWQVIKSGRVVAGLGVPA